MHETLLAQAALPAQTSCLGKTLLPFSIGHLLWLYREDNPLLKPTIEARSLLSDTPEALSAAVLICSRTWAQLQNLRGPIVALELFIWKRRVSRAARKYPGPIAGQAYFIAQAAIFKAHLQTGSAEFQLSDLARPDRAPAPRFPGCPFLLRLQQWLMIHFRLSEPDAWDYPFALAKMRWACHWEMEGGLEVYNDHDAQFDAFIAEQERQGSTQPICSP